ncbi:galactose oxidase early set domain-containing protein [Streptomyces meridianus]|uniref:Galactose oxidase early set domain-containing protein n=1 Tax=Streptomyces meridianus TaxID=2938945 RepID=A0ABT0X6S6_9ACTN|nr:galactose oxidase early set domain-containing protein [Streptomyces meridianus]MCM2578231.1 galactose oxidase early set domain-containing protein [Streptomyces meridianus]
MVVLAGLNAPAAVSYAQRTYHAYKIEQPGYKASFGHWDLLPVPAKFRVNAIHAALLHTGKVLLIAGSGNRESNFDAGSFKTLLWNPADDTFKLIPTPTDLFCGGHAQLPGGKLLVAGGTARYEILEGKVERAAGPMLVKNEAPSAPRTLPRGTVFRAPDGKEYRTTRTTTVPAAKKRTKKGKIVITAGEKRIFVEAVRKGRSQTRSAPAQFAVVGLTGAARRNVYGLAGDMTMNKQDYQGLDVAYEFDPTAERYVAVDPMAKGRWYPTLVTLADGRVMAVSGLDDMGQIINGVNEIFDPRTRKWSKAPKRYFPTYPALFLTKGGKLFFSGSNAGYGPSDKGRRPGLWDLEKNTFQPAKGLRDADRTETSASVLLPPAQDQKVMILGGGGVGESRKSSRRTAIADLEAARREGRAPRFTDGPDLPQGTRYLSSVLLPDDTVFTTGGSSDYRGRSASDIHKAQFYSPDSNTFRPAASPVVGRNYHSSALLLPDGRVATFGSDPLYADPDNTQTGTFEQRVEIYTPPYLYRKSRPALSDGPDEVHRGDTAAFRVRSDKPVTGARLMRPSAVTHTTDVEQRSIELELRRSAGSVELSVPKDPTLVPAGWYMLFVTDSAGTPSEARWVHVG